MKSNFEFLQNWSPILANIGNTAEAILYTDSNICLIKLGMFGETVVNLMLRLDDIAPPEIDNTHANRIRLLKREGLIPHEIDDILYSLRVTRNDAIHQNYEDLEKCKILLQMTHTLGVWFMQTYGDLDDSPKSFALPIQDNTDYKALLSEQEEVIKQLSLAIDTIKSDKVSPSDRLARSKNAVSKINLSEDQTRCLIDEQLRKVGWEADTHNLRHSKGSRPQKGKNLAIAEWPTNSTINESGTGKVDYALFVGLKLVAVLEAKSSSTDISSVLDVQCKDYASNIKQEHAEYLLGEWGDYQVPFVFASNGRKYLAQFKEKSGIWFRDLRKSFNKSQALQGWVSPSGIMEWFEKDIPSSNNTLQNTSKDILIDPNGLNLRDYQVDAITAAENAIMEGAQTALLAMATGTGKTRTILGMIYRFLKSGRFRRILFLVDRTSLGEQAQDVFKDVKLEELMTLNEIYNIKNLEDRDIDQETRIQVATVQSLVRRILLNDDEKMPSVSDYDLIVVDEAHRGYILDKEMSEDEYLYRNQNDYISKYRSVINYFDAVKIALTATPATHTTEIFGEPVYDYCYRQAVIDGYLVDHDAPHTLTTKLSTEGIKYEKGETVPVYDPITGEITNSAELTDELKFEIEQFNRKVITRDFNATVLKEIAKDINPNGSAKTLIYAVDNQHADMIVTILREIYEPHELDSGAIVKITSQIGDRKRVLDVIRRFKNEQFPSIVVTVDLLTTGIDVPTISTLVFMRRIKSRILFEQMLGRATRLCPGIDKTHFEIYDPVGVYETLQPFSTMKPVVVNPSATFTDILNGLDVVSTDAQIQYQIDMLVAKLRRKQRTMTDPQNDHFDSMSEGKTPSQFMDDLKPLSTEERKTVILNKRALFEMLDTYKTDAHRAVVVSDKPDELLTHTRGYGKGQKPQDYLDEFKTFIAENTEKIEALNLVCTRPTTLTREALRSLKLELDRHGFSEIKLNSAWKETTNEAIAADIISFIRSQALGSNLVGHNERIHTAVMKLKKAHSFDRTQQDWLDRIEKFLLTETVLNEETFSLGAFKANGGFTRIDKFFNNKLKEYIVELNKYLYDDSKAA